MFCNWWDNPTNPDSWHKHQVRSSSTSSATSSSSSIRQWHQLAAAACVWLGHRSLRRARGCSGSGTHAAATRSEPVAECVVFTCPSSAYASTSIECQLPYHLLITDAHHCVCCCPPVCLVACSWRGGALLSGVLCSTLPLAARRRRQHQQSRRHQQQLPPTNWLTTQQCQ